MQLITDDLRARLIDKFQVGMKSFAGRIEIGGQSYPTASMAIDKNKRMQSDQMIVVLPNEAVELGWGITNIFPVNTRIKAFQWYGDPANEVQVFDGLIDNPIDHRDVIQMTLNCRGRFALLVDQTFSASAPQGAGESGAVRTPDNGVYLNMEVADIVNDILDRVGWPADDRHITATSMVVTEYPIGDGSSYADAIVGDNALTTLTGYDAWSDETGVFHFDPTPASDIVEVPAEPVYTWRTGVDITELSDSTDQYELITRVKTRGPLTTVTVTDGWHLVWQTTKISRPVGIFYDPDDPTLLRVLSASTKRIYRLRISDRQVVSSVLVGGVAPYPLGLSIDPADHDYYWLLNAPWYYTGSTSGNSVKKIRRVDNVVVDSFTIPDGRWSALKVSSSYLYLTNLDTDRFYRRSKTDGSAIANYQHVVASVTQTNPSGLMIDGSTLFLFWANGGTTRRFLKCDESAPATVTGSVATSGSTLHGGEMNTTTHTECWGDNDSLGITAEFSLITTTTGTVPVNAEIGDQALEDALGLRAELEDRIHDLHPGDAAHPWESRRMSLDLQKIDSLAQANDIAKFWLDKLGRPKRVIDAGIIGNPAVQLNDLARVEDPKTGVFQNGVIDALHTEMDTTFLGTVTLVRGGVANDEITEPDPPPIDDSGDATDPAASALYDDCLNNSVGAGTGTVDSLPTTVQMYNGDVFNAVYAVTQASDNGGSNISTRWQVVVGGTSFGVHSFGHPSGTMSATETFTVSGVASGTGSPCKFVGFIDTEAFHSALDFQWCCVLELVTAGPDRP